MSVRRAFESLLACSAILVLGLGTAGAQVEKSKGKAAPKRLDLNSATVQELETLPGVGPAIAKKIVDGRPYKTVDELAKAGLPTAEIEKIRSKVEVVEPKDEGLAARVDLNTADEAALVGLPGIGPALAKAIIDGRPYPNVEALRKVKGFGPAKFDAIKDLVKVGNVTAAASAPDAGKSAATKKAAGAMPKTKAATLPPGTKININTATLAELDVLPGIGPARAQAIIDARPFAKPEDIMKVKGIKEVEFGKIKDMIIVK